MELASPAPVSSPTAISASTRSAMVERARPVRPASSARVCGPSRRSNCNSAPPPTAAPDPVAVGESGTSVVTVGKSTTHSFETVGGRKIGTYWRLLLDAWQKSCDSRGHDRRRRGSVLPRERGGSGFRRRRCAPAGDARNRQGLSWGACAGRCRPDRPIGRGALPARAERRREVDPYQDPFRRIPSGRGRDRLGGNADHLGEPTGGQPPRHRDDLSGTRPRGRPDRRREHLPRPRIDCCRVLPSRGHGSAIRGLADQTRPPGDPAGHGGPSVVHRAAADRIDRSGAVPRRPTTDHGRTLGGAGSGGGREPLPAGLRPAGGRGGGGLHLAPTGGDPADRRPDHGAEGRPDRGQRPAGDRHRNTRRHPDDDRQVDRVRLPHPAGSCGRICGSAERRGHLAVR